MKPFTAVKTLPDVSSWKPMHTLLKSDPRNALLKHYLIYSSLYNLTPLLKYCSVLNQKKTPTSVGFNLRLLYRD